MLLHNISETLPNSDCNLPQIQILLNPSSNESPKIALNQGGLLKTTANLKDQNSGFKPLSPSTLIWALPPPSVHTFNTCGVSSSPPSSGPSWVSLSRDDGVPEGLEGPPSSWGGRERSSSSNGSSPSRLSSSISRLWVSASLPSCCSSTSIVSSSSSSSSSWGWKSPSIAGEQGHKVHGPCKPQGGFSALEGVNQEE